MMSKEKANTIISHNIKHSATDRSKLAAAKDTSTELYCVPGNAEKSAFSKCSTNLQNQISRMPLIIYKSLHDCSPLLHTLELSDLEYASNDALDNLSSIQSLQKVELHDLKKLHIRVSSLC